MKRTKENKLQTPWLALFSSEILGGTNSTDSPREWWCESFTENHFTQW